jgi:hypothetical protein
MLAGKTNLAQGLPTKPNSLATRPRVRASQLGLTQARMLNFDTKTLHLGTAYLARGYNPIARKRQYYNSGCRKNNRAVNTRKAQTAREDMGVVGSNAGRHDGLTHRGANASRRASKSSSISSLISRT